MKNPHPQENPSKVVAGKTKPPTAYQIMTIYSPGSGQTFATLAGAQRALEKARLLYPDSFIARV